MIKDIFNQKGKLIGLKDIDIGSYLFDVFNTVKSNLDNRSSKNLFFDDNKLCEYIFQEFIFLLDGCSLERINQLISEKFFFDTLVIVVTDKFFFNELNQYHAFSLVSSESPVVSTMDIVLNFIFNRIDALKKSLNEKNVLLDMMSKVFLMFKSVNYLLCSGAETEAFATWRTIHELECIIRIIYDNPSVIPVYEKHIVYNNAFRDYFDDKDAQQAVIDDLKVNMKSHQLKSKDMKKYIEYGWLYSIDGIEDRIANFKLNFRNGLEAVAGLSAYSHDYEMSSEVAHSSPLLIYSNKIFFKSVAIVRNYESFLRLEDLFYSMLISHPDVDSSSYEKMRNLYLPFCQKVLNKEISTLQSNYNKK